MKAGDPGTLEAGQTEMCSGGGSGTDDQDAILRFVRRCSEQVICKRRVQDLCRIVIRRDGNWFILEGWVDSQSTKSEIFSLIPEFDNARWIVDRLRIGTPRQ